MLISTEGIAKLDIDKKTNLRKEVVVTIIGQVVNYKMEREAISHGDRLYPGSETIKIEVVPKSIKIKQNKKTRK